MIPEREGFLCRFRGKRSPLEGHMERIGMETATVYPWERLGDSVLVTFVFTFLWMTANSVLKIREKACQSCGDHSTDFLKQFVSLYPTLGGHSDHVGEIHAIGAYFIPKVSPSRRDELRIHVENVLQEMDNYEDEPIEYLKMLVKHLKD